MDGTVCQGCCKKKCPNKIESFWKDKDGNVKQVIDCAPKRTVIMLQELTNRQIAQQKSVELMKDELDHFTSQIRALSLMAQGKKSELPENDLHSLPNCQLQHRDGQIPPPLADSR